MTKEEAEKKICPLLPPHEGFLLNCRTTDCMMWIPGVTQDKEEPTGDCGFKK